MSDAHQVCAAALRVTPNLDAALRLTSRLRAGFDLANNRGHCPRCSTGAQVHIHNGPCPFDPPAPLPASPAPAPAANGAGVGGPSSSTDRTALAGVTTTAKETR